MKFFKDHFFHRAHLYVDEHKKLFSSLVSYGIISVMGAVIFAMFSIMGAHFFGGEKNAGIMIATFRVLVIVIFIPIFAFLADNKGAHVVLKVGIICEIVGSSAFLFSQNKWAFLIMVLGFFLRWNLFDLSPLILNNAKKNRGGFWFGFRDEIFALGNFLGLIFLPYFLLQTNWSAIAAFSVINSLIALFLIRNITDTPKVHKKSSFIESINIYTTLRKGIHFIGVNHKFPIFAIGSKFFHGIFYGAIWFLFPLHFLQMANAGGLSLGIHEISTLVLAIMCGMLADRIDWKKLERISWGTMLFLAWILVFENSYSSLVFLGFFIGIANNFFTAASFHALTRFNQDQEENGAFSGFLRIITNLGYMISPLICGFLYQYSGFQSAMVYLAISISIIGMWMIGFCTIIKKSDEIELATEKI